MYHKYKSETCKTFSFISKVTFYYHLCCYNILVVDTYMGKDVGRNKDNSKRTQIKKENTR